MGVAGLGVSYRFECTNQEGAVLVLANYATKSALMLDGIFKDYMLQNHQRWHHFATTTGIRRDPQDIILVRGTIKTTEWAVAAVFDAGQQVHEVVFDGHFGDLARVGARYSAELSTACSFEQRVGPYTRGAVHGNPLHPSEPVSAGQCIFLSYFKVKYRLFIQNKIVANSGDSGSSPDNDASPSQSMMVLDTASEMEIVTDTSDDPVSHCRTVC